MTKGLSKELMRGVNTLNEPCFSFIKKYWHFASEYMSYKALDLVLSFQDPWKKPDVVRGIHVTPSGR